MPLSPLPEDSTAPSAVAQRIRDLAAAHGMMIPRDSDLDQCLAAIRTGDQIPVAALAVVAEVLFTVLASTHSPALETAP